MHRLLRPVSRALRAQGSASCSRHIARALPAAQTRGFSATGTTRKNKKMTDVDDLFFGAEEAEADEVVAVKATVTPAADVKDQPEKPQAPVAEAKVVEVDLDVDADADTFGFLAEEEPTVEETLPTTPDTDFNANEYFASWLSPAAREALVARGGNQYDYICTLLETEPAQNFLGTLENEYEDFERLWDLYEWRRATDPQAIVPFLAFLLRRGVLLKAPSLDAKSAEDCIASVQPEIVTEAFSTLADGQWNIDDASKPPSATLDYPDLMEPDAILDPRDVTEFPATPDSPFNNRVIVRNHRSVFHTYPSGTDDLLGDDSLEQGKTADNQREYMKTTVALTRYYADLHQTVLMRRRVVHQTGKGKVSSVFYLILLGDGKGLVGYGSGQHEEREKAVRMARIDALRNMDTVARFEDRTIWTEMSTKFGATQIHLRPRPVGFGLRCNPYLHQIMRAAGFKDISGKVWGSRNKLNVIKAVIRMLHAGHAPTGMGDGLGGKGKTMERGFGMRDKGEIERARGRKLINLRK